MVVGPFADELKAIEKNPTQNGSQNQVPTLLWSLDGVMRYLPMAALYDGQNYMVERFNNVLFTPESYGHMAAPTDVKVGYSCAYWPMGCPRATEACLHCQE